MHYLHYYIKGCHICQLSKKDNIPTRQFQTRINLNCRPLSRLSMDFKVMSKSRKGHKFILCITDEMTNYLITVPIYHARSKEIGDALINNVISKYGIPEFMIIDQDSAFMSTLMTYLFGRLNIKIKTVAPYNHQSLQVEHGIKSLSTICSFSGWYAFPFLDQWRSITSNRIVLNMVQGHLFILGYTLPCSVTSSSSV